MLELKAALFGLKVLYPDLTQLHFLIRIDNITAVAAINKMGSTKSLPIDNAVQEILEVGN